MHYFQWNIKTYRADTAHLTNDEDLAYRRLIEHYYDTEQPIPTDLPPLCRRLRLALPVVESVLHEFFSETPEGWIHGYIDSEIKNYHSFIARQKANGSKGGRGNKADAKPDKPTALPDKPSAKPTINKEPLTTNQEPPTKNQGKSKDMPPPAAKASAKKGTRLPENWVLPKSWGEFALAEKPNWSADDVRRVAEDFRDYWLGKSGKDATKVDWLATWRKWVRSPLNDIKSGRPNKFNPNEGRDLDAELQAFLNADGGNVIEGESKNVE